MKHLLFIDYVYHQRTKSHDFMVSFLSEKYHVTCCYIDPSIEAPYSELETVPRKDFNVLVCWMIMPPREILDRQFSYRHAALIPMIDYCPRPRRTEAWYPYRDYNIICFSETLSNRLVKSGLSAKYIQYFPEPNDAFQDWGDRDSAYFWYRKETVNLSLVKTLFSKIGLNHLHIHNVPDSGKPPLKPESNGKIRKTYSEWYGNKNDLYTDMADSAYYIAPRTEEGIGMAFLEAMAMGRCVVAADRPTMNEYICHSETGLLYNLKKIEPLSPHDVRKIQKQSYDFIKQGYKRWEKDQEMIYKWLETPAKISRYRIFFSMIWRFISRPIKVLRMAIMFTSLKKRSGL